MGLVTVDQPAPGAAPAEADTSPSECLHCSTPLGHEVTFAVMFTDPEPNIGIIGFLHGTNCVDAWYGLHLLDPDAWRLVEVE